MHISWGQMIPTAQTYQPRSQLANHSTTTVSRQSSLNVLDHASPDLALLIERMMAEISWAATKDRKKSRTLLNLRQEVGGMVQGCRGRAAARAAELASGHSLLPGQTFVVVESCLLLTDLPGNAAMTLPVAPDSSSNIARSKDRFPLPGSDGAIRKDAITPQGTGDSTCRLLWFPSMLMGTSGARVIAGRTGLPSSGRHSAGPDVLNLSSSSLSRPNSTMSSESG